MVKSNENRLEVRTYHKLVIEHFLHRLSRVTAKPHRLVSRVVIEAFLRGGAIGSLLALLTGHRGR